MAESEIGETTQVLNTTNIRDPSTETVMDFQKVHTQGCSPLWKIPQELRDMVYAHLFLDTRLSFGTIKKTRIEITPAKNSLAFLRTCRRANSEVGDTWLSQVLFNFEGAVTMMDKLAALPSSKMSKIRHIRLRGDMVTLYGDRDNFFYSYALVSVLKLLPSLNLDTLTVLTEDGDYSEVNRLVLFGQSWKELRYISRCSSILGGPFHFTEHGYWWRRRVQPSHWIGILNSRDGIHSHPSVTIYRSTIPGMACAVMCKDTRLQYQQKPPAPGEESEFVERETKALMSEDEVSKELMIVVRRGNSSEYEQKQDSSPPIYPDISEHFPGKSWSQLRGLCFDDWEFCLEDDDWCDEDFRNKFPALRREVDVYKHAHDYEWFGF
ncbi:hypothetical protein F5Y16DRAFT_421820 [Xylariaceae sp. FL0255]|nr:hypothetical protein F5Y16DRAFT_421820 [Xylariaceae sp. FL0255]